MHIEVTGAEDLRRASAQLRTVADGKAMRRDLMKGLRQGVLPAVASVKAAALALPAHGPKSTGLRRRIARATSPQVRTGGRNPIVRVRISRRGMGDQAALPRVLNERQFRHPVYGNRDLWVSQRGVPGWFERAIRPTEPAVRKEMEAVLDRLEKSLAHR
jgi:hypothetical protein